MKRLLSFALTFLILCSLTIPAFAAEITDGSDVVAKYNITYEGEYRAELIDGSATAGGISVTGAPENAVTLVVVPMEGDALTWVDSCVSGDAVAAYDIHFLDTQGNRINANGAKVSINVSGSELQVSSVTTSGTDRKLTSEMSGSQISFTTDGSHYYVICGKSSGEQPGPGDIVTVPVRGDENTVHADVTIVDEDTVKLEEMDFEEIDHVVGDHVETGVVEIDLTGLDDDVTKVVLPVNTVEHIVEAAEEAHNDTEALQITFPFGSVKLDDKAMRAIVEQAECNEVMLVLENVGETRLNEAQNAVIADWNVYGGYEAYILCVASNKRISDFEGGVATLSVPFTVPAGLDGSKFSVWYVADDGNTEKLDTHYANGQLVWDVSHFSDFIIVYEDVVETHTVTVKDTDGGEVTVSNTTPKTGETVIISVKPDEGKTVDQIKVTDESGETMAITDNGDGTYSFTQPNGDVTVQVTFKTKPSGNLPQTGDTMHLHLWILLLLISGMILIYLGNKMRRQDTK